MKKYAVSTPNGMIYEIEADIAEGKAGILEFYVIDAKGPPEDDLVCVASFREWSNYLQIDR